jgi:hypothetical protein
VPGFYHTWSLNAKEEGEIVIRPYTEFAVAQAMDLLALKLIQGEMRDGVHVEIMGNLLETIELADQTGLDVFAIGEHHREEYLSSAPVVILAAAAARTKNIRLSTAVTVLSSDDPVRVFQSFATLDLLSNGRPKLWPDAVPLSNHCPVSACGLRIWL